MVLELRVPRRSDWSAIRTVLPVLFLYLLSFVLLAIYWNNHHHLLGLTERVSGSVLSFWLSLVPFPTRWMGENNFESLPVATGQIAVNGLYQPSGSGSVGPDREPCE